MDLPRSSPARLTASATLKLPRWGLVLLCLLYIVPGLIGRDPWKTEDATGFGVMWTMASGSWADWMIPNVAGAPVFDSGPLMYWVGALCIKLVQFISIGTIDAPLAARLATVLFFLTSTTALWYATYLLGRRASAQPLALAFGGQPEPRDYGRVLADGALLILLGTLGLVARAHESSSDVAMLAMLCVSLYGMARSLDQPRVGAAWVGAGLVGLALTRGPYPACALALLWLLLLLARPDWKASRIPALVITLPATLIGLTVWPLLAHFTLPGVDAYFAARGAYWANYPDGIDLAGLHKYAKSLPWFTLPGWPLAVWAVWSWRRHMASPHILLPLGYVVAVLAVMSSTSDTADGLALMLLPGIVMLAAFGLPTLKRGAANAIDWFSLLVYSFVALLVWFSWITRVTGWPPAWFNSIARQAPGLEPEFRPLVLGLALLLTLGWFWVVRWRIVTHPKVLWRSVVLASGGVILSWALLTTLWIHFINYSRTYREVALSLEQALPDATHGKGACVATDGLGLPQRASFAYFAGVRFARIGFDAAQTQRFCSYLLRQDSLRQPRDTLPVGGWQMIWEGRRASDRDERYRVFRRIPDGRAVPVPPEVGPFSDDAH